MKKIFSLVCSLVLVLGANATSTATKASVAQKVPATVEQMLVETPQLVNLDLNLNLNAAPALEKGNAVKKSVTQEETIVWGEWTDFAPLGFNTGKYAFATFEAFTQTGLVVQIRRDETQTKTQFLLKNWGKGYYTSTGLDLILNMASDSTFTFVSDTFNVGADVTIQDVATAYDNPAYAAYNYYDTENSVFNFYTSMVIASTGGIYTNAQETLTMDRPITERDTVDVVSTNFLTYDLRESYNIGWFSAQDAEGFSDFRIAGVTYSSLSGTFSFADTTINSNNSYYQVTGSTTKNYFQNGEITTKITDDGDTLTGWVIGTDEKYYRLNWTKKKKWDERDTVYLSAQGVTIEEAKDKTTGTHTGWLYINQTTPGYDYIILQSVGEPKYGTFSYADKTLGSNYYNLMPTEGKNQQFQSGSITVGEVGDSIVLDGICIGEDEKAYVLHFAQSNKVLNYDTDAPFDANYAYHDMTASMEDGIITIYANNDETAIGLELYADPAATTIPAGVFTIDTTMEAGTALQSMGVSGGYLTKCYAGNRAESGSISDCFFMVSGTITLSYDEYGKLNVEVDALNSYDQPVTATITYTKLTPKDTVQIRDVDFFISEEYKEKYGLIYYEIVDGMAVVSDLYVYTDTIFGDFKDVIDFGDCVLWDTAFNLLSVLDADVFTVLAEGKNMTLTAKVLGSDTILYDIVATGYLSGLFLDAKEDYEGTFAYETITLTQATKTQVMINAGSSEIQDTVALVVDAKLNKSGKLAAGEYKGVMASTGLTSEYQITPSFTGNTQGNWYIQSGALTVNADESMVFVGLNSYDKTVTINFAKPQPVALKEVNAGEAVVKYFDGNKIVIRKGDKMFNILGAEL